MINILPNFEIVNAKVTAFNQEENILPSKQWEDVQERSPYGEI